MKAAVLYEANTPLKIEEVTLDEPQDQEVLVKMVATGVCHTDLHVVKGQMGSRMPIILGHEGAGIVEQVGPGVTTLKPGDHVILMVLYTCGKCAFCTVGLPTRCSAGLIAMAMGSLPGGGKRIHKGDQEISHFFSQSSFAEYAVVNERTAVKIREDAPLEVAALLGCGSTTGIGAVLNTADIKAGDSIVVYGCGGVGQSALMAAKLAGAGKIIAVDVLDHKLDVAKELGADYVINATREEPPKRVMEITGGGADHAIETAGSNVDIITQAFASIHMAGKCVVVGTPAPGAKVSLSPTDFMLGKTITGCVQGGIRASVDVPKYVDLYMTGKLPLEKLVSRNYGLDDINDALDAIGEGEVIRSVIRF